MDDIDIWRAAHAMMRRYGETAWLESTQRADQALAAGDVEGARTWNRVAKAVTDLDRQKPGDGEAVN